MSTRRPLQPLSPPAANIVGAKYSYEYHCDARNGSNGRFTMVNDDPQAFGDGALEPLTDLENDTQADDFDRLMLQNARDERRINDALQGKVQPFRKARVHPRVGVTLENLERHNAKDNGVHSANAHVQHQSSPSSSGSTRSDPAIQPPSGWGRKARVKRNWMRTITSDAEQQTPIAQEDTPDRFTADLPRPSVEDSPLSRKGSLQGTPAASRQQRLDDEWSFDLDAASVIASTPYLPRNTALDDIRQREMHSLREQGVTTSRLGQIRESSPEEKRRPRSSSAKSATSQTSGTAAVEHPGREVGSPERLRKRTTLWQNIGKGQLVKGQGVENSPVVVYNRSSETVEVVDRGALGNAQLKPLRPPHRRDNSQDLLRKLARVSNTPSPRTAPRPHSARPTQPGSSSQTMVTETSPTKQTAKGAGFTTEPAKDADADESNHTDDTPPQIQSQQPQKSEGVRVRLIAPASSPIPPRDVDTTPMPEERSILNPKTPVVTGAWIDTPRPATVLQPNATNRSRSRSPEKRSLSTKSAPTPEEPTPPPPEATRPNLPRSALSALVEEARANSRPGDFGDDTINSLEGLITPLGERSDEDTLQGLQLPTSAPKNESEKQRQQELLHLHRMNDRLRAARTSIRDASRGIRRVEHQVEQVEDRDENGKTVRIVTKTCPAVDGVQKGFWREVGGLFWDEQLMGKRWGWGLTGLSMALMAILLWVFAESAACELYCQHDYASSFNDYGIRWNAPQYPYVIPTLIYRTFVQFWWRPLWAVPSFIGGTLSRSISNSQAVGTAEIRAHATEIVKNVLLEEDVLGMSADEIVR